MSIGKSEVNGLGNAARSVEIGLSIAMREALGDNTLWLGCPRFTILELTR
jgi:hypothetical protein